MAQQRWRLLNGRRKVAFGAINFAINGMLDLNVTHIVKPVLVRAPNYHSKDIDRGRAAAIAVRLRCPRLVSA